MLQVKKAKSLRLNGGVQPFLGGVCALALGIAMVVMSPSAQAQTEPPGEFQVRATATVVSDYRSRGVSLSNNGIAFQPSVHVKHESGAYVGAWASSMQATPLRGSLRTHLYGGYVAEIAPGLELDLGMTYLYYPDGDPAVGDSDFGEVTGDLTYSLGPVQAEAKVFYNWDQSALRAANVYGSFTLSGGVPGTPVSLRSHIGYADGGLVRYGPDGHYWDWSVGATANLGAFSAGVKYVDTSIPMSGNAALDKFYDSTVLFSLGVAF